MPTAYDTFIKLAIKRNYKDSEDFLRAKKELCGKLKISIPTNADLREHYEKMIKMKKIKRKLLFEKIMLSRRIRTQSGVAVVAVLTKPYPCPGKCIYCPDERGMPKSYLSNEPAVMRAIASKFDPALQVWNRLRSLELNGHVTDKIELIVMGGTFSYLPKGYQGWFIWQCFKACNEYPKHETCNIKHVTWDILFKEQKKNEKAKHRIVGLTLETRPDFIDEKEIKNFRELGCTRVELGVQSIFDDVLELNKRGHDVQATIQATKLLKDAGFKINYHIMPGLPGSSLKRDYQMFSNLFSNKNFQPDMLKIYPTVVIKSSTLYKLWKRKKTKNSIIHNPAADGLCITEYLGDYKPLTDKQFSDFITKIKNKIIPPYVRISRLVRDVPATSIVAGPKISNLRQIIAPKSKCRCIRCREVRADYNIKDLPAMLRNLNQTNKSNALSTSEKKLLTDGGIAMQAGKIVLDRIDYKASGGKEIFLQYVSLNRKKLFALLRLRISNLEVRLPSDKLYKLIPVLKNAALVREVHTYGKLTPINKKDKKSPQHIGLGKRLMREAERIAGAEFNLDKIVVISGVGVRDYYRRLGYRQKDTYMVKRI